MVSQTNGGVTDQTDHQWEEDRIDYRGEEEEQRDWKPWDQIDSRGEEEEQQRDWESIAEVVAQVYAVGVGE